VTSSRDPIYLGLDVGGTKVAAGLVTGRGEILSRIRVPMRSQEGAAAGLLSVEEAIDAALNVEPSPRAVISGIGIVCPGPLDPRLGIVVNPVNLPCWRNFPLVAQIQKSRGLPTTMDNDANAAALAESIWGAGAGYSSVFYVTIGTGIGTGLVLDGHVYHGRTGAAAEGGHISIDYQGPQCACGKKGCIEALAAGPAVARRARAMLAAASAPNSKLLALADGNPNAVTSESVGRAWREGDALATAVLEETVDLLAVWLGNMIDLLEPDVIIFGGGMSELVSAWFDRLREQLPAWSVNSRCSEIPIVRAHYGEDSGIAGGAALCVSAKLTR
jgi:glucokinase